MECPCGVHLAQIRRPLLPSSLPRRPLRLLPKPSSLSFLSRAPFLAAASRRLPPPVRASISPRGPATDEVLKGALSVLLRPVSVALAMGVALFFARLHKPSLALALPAAESDSTPYPSPATDDYAPVTEEEKERALEEYLDSYPEDARALRALMRLKIQARKPAEAIAIVDRLVLLEPRDRGLPLLRAHMQSQGGDNEAAKQVFEEMLQRDPFIVEAYHGLVMAASHSEEPERELRGVLERIQGAVEVCKKERRKEELRDFKLLVAQVKVLQRDYGEALRVYQELVKEEPRDFRPYLCQGIIYAELGKKREAEKQFQKYRRLVPKGHPYAQYFDEDMVATNVFSQMGGSKRSAALKRLWF